MKRIFLTTALFIMAAIAARIASAQPGYDFSASSSAYTRLINASSVTRHHLWTSDSSYSIPIGFSFDLAGTATNTIYLKNIHFISFGNAAVESGFMMPGTALMDRGSATGVSKSDICYTTSGIAGSRIFKMELFNAGFEYEYLNSGQLQDSVCLQLWLYEGSNIVEFRYGPSSVTRFNDYFGAKIMTGYLQHVDTATNSFDHFYSLSGQPAGPVMDSVTTAQPGLKGLSSMPANGTVYRFTPKHMTTVLHDSMPHSLIRMYPTACSRLLFVEQHTGNELSYKIATMNNHVVAGGTLTDGRNAIDVSAISPGIYTIYMIGRKSEFDVMRFVKE